VETAKDSTLLCGELVRSGSEVHTRAELEGPPGRAGCRRSMLRPGPPRRRPPRRPGAQMQPGKIAQEFTDRALEPR